MDSSRLTRSLAAPMSALAVTVLAVACGGSDGLAPGTGVVGSVAVAPANMSLGRGDSAVLVATVKGGDGHPLADQPVAWTSNATDVVAVSTGGIVRALSTGSAVVTVTAGDKKATATVTVGPSAASIVVVPDTVTILPGASLQLTAIVRDADGNVLPDFAVTWGIVSHQCPPMTHGCLSLTPTGLLSVMANLENSIVVEASAGGHTATATVRVRFGPVAQAVLAPSVAAAPVGSAVPISVVATDPLGNALPMRVITWTSSNPAVATVLAPDPGTNGQGRTSATVETHAPGTAIITGSIGGKDVTLALDVLTVRYTAVSTGNYHACALTDAGKVVCWGTNNTGSVGHAGLGTGIPMDNSMATMFVPPLLVQTTQTFTKLFSSGYSGACALDASGAASCWGTFGIGTGPGLAAPPDVPTPAGGALRWTMLSGGYNACGVTTAGTAYCWGLGPLGDGSTSSSVDPVAVAGGLTFKSVAAGVGHSCGLTTAGAAYCWGGNEFGQLGNGDTTVHRSLVPVAVAGGLTFAQISSRTGFTCALTSSGQAYCWGLDFYGNLGAPRSQFCADPPNNRVLPCSDRPVPVSGGLQFTGVKTSTDRACGLTTSGAVYCWGGSPPPAPAGTPTLVPTGKSFTSIDLGAGFGCGLATDGLLYCWGRNSSLELGVLTPPPDTTTAVKVLGQP